MKGMPEGWFWGLYRYYYVAWSMKTRSGARIARGRGRGRKTLFTEVYINSLVQTDNKDYQFSNQFIPDLK